MKGVMKLFLMNGVFVSMMNASNFNAFTMEPSKSLVISNESEISEERVRIKEWNAFLENLEKSDLLTCNVFFYGLAEDKKVEDECFGRELSEDEINYWGSGILDFTYSCIKNIPFAIKDLKGIKHLRLNDNFTDLDQVNLINLIDLQNLEKISIWKSLDPFNPSESKRVKIKSFNKDEIRKIIYQKPHETGGNVYVNLKSIRENSDMPQLPMELQEKIAKDSVDLTVKGLQKDQQ